MRSLEYILGYVPVMLPIDKRIIGRLANNISSHICEPRWSDAIKVHVVAPGEVVRKRLEVQVDQSEIIRRLVR